MPEPERPPTSFDQLQRDLTMGDAAMRLHAYGELIRHGVAPGISAEDLRQSLAEVEVSKLAEIVSGVDVGRITDDMKQAARDAFETAFCETEAEAAMFRSSACDALGSRDRLANLLVATNALCEVAPASELDLVRSCHATLARAASMVDQVGRKLVRELTGANVERRRRAETLSADARQEAYWFTSWADRRYDCLLECLANGRPVAGADVELIAEIERSAIPRGIVERDSAARDEAISSALFRLSVGGSGDDEVRFAERIALRDPDVARAMKLARDTSDDDG